MSILIVNPFVSQEYLSEKFKQNNIKCIALYTCDLNALPAYSRPSPTLFDQQIFINSNDVKVLHNALKEMKFDYIINGAEESTAITDQLTEIMLPELGNSSQSSRKRFDKYHMQEALRNAGLTTINTQEIESANAKIDQFKNLDYPVFCKPSEGHASIGAFKADSADMLIANLQIFAKNYPKYLIQEYVIGKEYVIDCFSLKGVHYIASIACYAKENYLNHPLYRYINIEENSEIWQICAEYIVKALDALEVKNGFTHNEVMIEKDGTIRLIELNNRISGAKGSINKIAKLSGLISQDEMLINYLKTDKISCGRKQKAQGFSRGLSIFNFNNSAIKDPYPQLKKINSVQEIIMLKKVGAANYLPTEGISLVDAACIVLLHNKNHQTLEEDSAEIFKLEKQGILV